MPISAPKYILWHHTKRVGHWLGWRLLHLFFPGVIHYFTDKYENKHHHLVLDTIYATTAIVLMTVNVGLAIWWTKIFVPVDVQVEVKVGDTILSNAPLNLDVILQNGPEAVEGTQVELELPVGFELTKADQLSAVQTQDGSRILTLEVGNLTARELQHVVIPGWFIGTIGQPARVRAFVTYTHFQHEWEVVDAVSFTPLVSNFEVSATIPPHVLNGQTFDWTIQYKNNASRVLNNARIDLTIPSDLLMQIVDGATYVANTTELDLPEIPAASEGTIQLQSAFHETADSNKLFVIDPQLKNVEEQYVSQGSQDVGADAIRPRISVGVAPNKSAVNLGDTVTYTINIQNIGDTELSQFVINADLSGEAFSVEGAYGVGATRSGSRLTWTLDQTIASGGTTQLRFTVPTRASLIDHNLSVKVDVAAQATISDIQVTTMSQVTSTEVKFNSNMSLATSPVFTGPSGEEFGYGPWPVQANNITAVRIFWSIKNINNDIHNTVISTTLPSQVEWTGSSSVSYGSALNYNAATRTVSWNVGTLPADGRTLGVSFEVRIFPNYLQVGKTIRLTNETRLTASDSFTGAALVRTALPVMTPDPVQPEE